MLTKYDNWYLVEVSGRIEYLFEHMNGYPIPNVYAEEILKKGVTLSDGELPLPKVRGFLFRR